MSVFPCKINQKLSHSKGKASFFKFFAENKFLLLFCPTLLTQGVFPGFSRISLPVMNLAGCLQPAKGFY
jgi:hypothetical protein